MSSKKVYFPGINALRFFAASLVVLMHMKSNLTSVGLPTFVDLGIFSKGVIAVSFFFVLSGFLITYLLFDEHQKNRRVSVKAFYLRRIYRIWPLYFLIILIGILFYWFVAPKIGLDFDVEYEKSMALLLYIFFGANLMNSLYHVGGILHVTWSIAVEEQFYLIWAPVFKKFKNKVKQILWFTLFISTGVATLNKINVFGLSEGWQLFLDTLQFHYMSLGGLMAYYYIHHKKSLLSLKVFSSGTIQIVLLVVLLAYLIFYQKTDWAEPILILPQGLLFGWIILNVSVNEHTILTLENKVLNHLGKVSYGIYMYHMIVVYALSFLTSKLVQPDQFEWYFMWIYAILALLLTVFVSTVSYNLFEKKLLIRGSKHSKRVIERDLKERYEKLSMDAANS